MKITVHRALARIKTTEKRLLDISDEVVKDACQDKILIDIYSNKNKVCRSTAKSEEETKKAIQSTWDKFNSLFDELVKLKRAITLSNAGVDTDKYDTLNTIKVCGENYIIAELIVLKTVIGFKKNFLVTMRAHYSHTITRFNNMQEDVNNALNRMLESNLGGDTKKLDKSVVDTISKQYLEMNAYTLVDPLNLSKKIEKMEQEIDTWETEADAAFSEANALRTIDFDVA